MTMKDQDYERPETGVDLIQRWQAARLLREQFPEADSCSIAHACWRAFQDGREECSRAELVEALKYYVPLGETTVYPKRDFRLKK
jgi:hypothetical protein